MSSSMLAKGVCAKPFGTIYSVGYLRLFGGRRMSEPKNPVERPRRFYKAVSAAPTEGGTAVLWDGRAVRTPAGGRLTAPTPALGEMLAAEWAAQGEHIEMASMPAVRLAFTALDRVAGARDEVAAEIARYAGADVLCYF